MTRFRTEEAQQRYEELMAQIERRRREDARMEWDDNAEMHP